MKTPGKKGGDKKMLLNLILECDCQENMAYQRYRIERDNLRILKNAAYSQILRYGIKSRTRK